MAKNARRERKARRQRRKNPVELDREIPFGKNNFFIFAVGVLVIIIGYFFFASSREGFLAMYLAPILLVSGYCVIFPIAILYREKDASLKRGE